MFLCYLWKLEDVFQNTRTCGLCSVSTGFLAPGPEIFAQFSPFRSVCSLVVHWWDTMDEWCFCIVERLSLREEYIKAVRFIFFIPVYKPIYSNFVRHLSEYLQDTEQLPKTSIKLFTQQTMLCCFCFARLFSLWKWQF